MKEFWDKHKADIGLAVLVIYTLCLGGATADQLFNLGLFPTKLDRMIGQAIDKLGSQDPEARDQAFTEIVQYGDFAVPQLIKALNQQNPVQEAAIKALKQITDQSMDDPAKWKEWYKQHKNEY